jgi:hypothetical protein
MHQKETITNLYAPNVIKHILKDIKAHLDSNTMIVEDFNTPITNRYVIQTKKSTKKS